MAAVVGAEDGELPALGILQLQVEVAVLATILGRDATSGLRDEFIVQEGDGRAVVRDLVSDGAAGAAAAAVADAPDLDFVATGGELASSSGELTSVTGMATARPAKRVVMVAKNFILLKGVGRECESRS
jgi:hypothetical protein